MKFDRENMPLLKELITKIRSKSYGRRRFGVKLLSTTDYYLFREEEIKAVYYNLIKIKSDGVSANGVRGRK